MESSASMLCKIPRPLLSSKTLIRASPLRPLRFQTLLPLPLTITFSILQSIFQWAVCEYKEAIALSPLMSGSRAIPGAHSLILAMSTTPVVVHFCSMLCRNSCLIPQFYSPTAAFTTLVGFAWSLRQWIGIMGKFEFIFCQMMLEEVRLTDTKCRCVDQCNSC